MSFFVAAVPAAPNKSSAPQVDSESECGLEDEDPSRLGMAGKAAVSILGLPFVAVGAALGAAGSILGTNHILHPVRIHEILTLSTHV